MSLKAATAVRTSAGPVGVRGGALGSRPSRSAAPANRWIGRVTRRAVHQARGASIRAVMTKPISRRICQGESQGRAGLSTAHLPSGRFQAAEKDGNITFSPTEAKKTTKLGEK